MTEIEMAIAYIEKRMPNCAKCAMGSAGNCDAFNEQQCAEETNVCETAIAALRAQAEQQNPEPLDVSQLQEFGMKSTPVWFDDGLFRGWYFVSRITPDTITFDQRGTCVTVSVDGLWRAYAHKPSREVAGCHS